MTGVSVSDQRLLANSWSSEGMHVVFYEKDHIQKWLDVETVLAKAQTKPKIIPKKTADEVTRKTHYRLMDVDSIFLEYKKTKHPPVPVARGLEKACDDNLGEYVHFRATIQDVIDTGLVLQFKEAMILIKSELGAAAKAPVKFVKTRKDIPIMGRTLAPQALPITFEHKVATWLSELDHHLERVLELEEGLYVGGIVDAVGIKTNLSDERNEVGKLTLENLKLGVPNISWQPARDRFIEPGFVLGNINTTFNEIAYQTLILTYSEVDEVAGPFGKGQIDSSTTSHKRNPAVNGNTVTVSNALKANLAILSDIERYERRRDRRVWRVGWKLLPEMFLMLSIVLGNMKFALSDLEVKKSKMLKDLSTLDGLILAERTIFALSDRYGKQHAHGIVYKDAILGIEKKKNFKEVLLTDKGASKVLKENEIDAPLDASTYVEYAPKLVDEFLAKIKGNAILK